MTAVSSIASRNANGNMTARGSQSLTWDVENRLTGVTGAASFVYDGDGKRVKKTENNETIVYINKYFEKNLTTGVITTYYYIGDRLVFMRKGTDLRFVSQDHLTGTSVTTDNNGTMVVGSIKYMPFGSTRVATGSLDTDIKFTGQRLDSGVDLYYYGARYYDANIGRFISADTIVSNPRNPQTLNRYSYALNNPLRYIDPTGHDDEVPDWSLIQSDDGTISWAYGDDKAAAIAGGASDITNNPVAGNYGQWYSGADSSDSGDRGVNTSVTVSPSNPGAAIAAGGNAGPALPGGTTVGVGGTLGPSNSALQSTGTVGIDAAHELDVVTLIALTIGATLDAQVIFWSGTAIAGQGAALVMIGAATSPTGVGIGVAIAGGMLVVAGAGGMWAGFMVGYKEWRTELAPAWKSVWKQ